MTTTKLTPAQRRILTCAANHKFGRVVGGDPRTRERLIALGLIDAVPEVEGYSYGPLFKITDAGRALVTVPKVAS